MDATQESLSEDLSPYQVHSRREIVALLRNVGEQRQMVNMLGNRGGAAVVTSILSVDDAAGTVIVDAAQLDVVNGQIVGSDNISFETVLDQIRILFFTDRIDLCQFEDLPALAFPLPASVIRLQRREYYRVPTPVVTPASCTIAIPQADSGAQRTVTLVLQNVSGGGIGIIDELGLLDRTVGRVYQNCRIDLPGGSLVVASLEIRNSVTVRLPNGKQVQRIGCLFVDLPHAMMAAVQRYITKLEREQNARAAGRLA